MHVGRRDLLLAFLGAKLGGLACKKPPTRPIPPGSILFPSEKRGHLIRAAEYSDAGSSAETLDVAIVGGGPSGLSAAWRLSGAGVGKLALFELDPIAGGTSKYSTKGTHSYPWGAHYITVPLAENTLLVRMLREFGTVEGLDAEGHPIIAEEQLCWAPDERLFYRGRWYDGLYLRAGATREDEAQYFAFRKKVEELALTRDEKGRRAFVIPIAKCAAHPDIQALDKITMSEWMDRHGFTSSRLRWLVAYACRDDYGALPEHTSAWAGLFYFASRVRAPGVDPQAVITWPEGNGYLVRKLMGVVGHHVRTDRTVFDVVPGEHDVVLRMLHDDRVGTVRAKRVIFAVPTFVTRHILRPYRERPPDHFADFDYGGWMVANLHLSGRPIEKSSPLAWDNVLYESPSLGYVVDTHQRGISRGSTVFTYYYPLCEPDAKRSRERLLSASREEWAEVALSELSLPHPDIRELCTELDVVRWGHGMIRPRPGFMWGTARRKASEPLGRVHFGHSDLSGAALFEEAVHQGVRAAEEVLAALEVKHEAWA